MSSMLHPINWNKQDSGNKHRFDDIKSGWTFAIKNLPENKPIISVAVNWYHCWCIDSIFNIYEFLRPPFRSGGEYILGK